MAPTAILFNILKSLGDPVVNNLEGAPKTANLGAPRAVTLLHNLVCNFIPYLRVRNALSTVC